jgi:hypothetical protein
MEKYMPTVFDFKKLRRLTMIHAVVQVALILLLIYPALLFQAALGPLFWKSIIITLVIQLANFYPVNLFATWEAKREVDSVAIGLTPDELKALRKKRQIGDVVKSGVFVFFIIFAFSVKEAPTVTGNRFIQSMIFFNFILTYLSYFQCFNFVAKREMKARTSQ